VARLEQPDGAGQADHAGPTTMTRHGASLQRQAPAILGAVGSSPARLLAGDVLLDVLDVVAVARHHREQVAHRGDLLDLLLDEPLHELLGGEVGLLAGDAQQRVDLLGDPLLLVQGERDRATTSSNAGTGASTPGMKTSWSVSMRYCTIIIAWSRSSSA
jgi:hypothetical protein